MPTLDTLQLPRIDTAGYGGREAKKIVSHLYQVEEQLRYVLGHLDEDNLSTGLKSKIESGGMSSEILQTLDAITLRVSGQDDAMAELRVSLTGITATVQEQGGAVSELRQTAESITSTVQANKELSAQQAAAALEQALQYTDTQLTGYPTHAQMSSAIEQRADSITSTVAAVYSTKTETAAKADAARDAANTYTDGQLSGYTTTVEMQSIIEQRAESITQTVAAAYATKTALSTVQQTASKISWVVKSGDSAADFTLTDRAVKLVADTIDLSGKVSFTDLSTAGKTNVNGANITTGIIQNAAGTTTYDLNAGTIRMGADGKNNIFMESDGVVMYKGGVPYGVMRTGVNEAFFGGRSLYTYYGYVNTDHPGAPYLPSDPNQIWASDFYGIRIENGGYATFYTRGLELNTPSGTNGLNVGQYASARGYRAWDESELHDLKINGRLSCSSTGSKDAALKTPYGTLLLTSTESPAPCFQDFGGGVCDADGNCYIALDERFLAVTEPRQRRRWFLTDTGGQGHLWAEDTPEGAAVHGAPGQAFDWMVLAAQRGTGGWYAEEEGAMDLYAAAGPDRLLDDAVREVGSRAAAAANALESDALRHAAIACREIETILLEG